MIAVDAPFITSRTSSWPRAAVDGFLASMRQKALKEKEVNEAVEVQASSSGGLMWPVSDISYLSCNINILLGSGRSSCCKWLPLGVVWKYHRKGKKAVTLVAMVVLPAQPLGSSTRVA